MPQRTLEDLRLRYATGGFIYERSPFGFGLVVTSAVPPSKSSFGRRSRERNASICARGMLTVPGEAKSFFADGCFVGLVASDEPSLRCLGMQKVPHTGTGMRVAKVITNWYNADTSLRLVKTRRASCIPHWRRWLSEPRNAHWLTSSGFRLGAPHPDTPARTIGIARDEVVLHLRGFAGS